MAGLALACACAAPSGGRTGKTEVAPTLGQASDGGLARGGGAGGTAESVLDQSAVGGAKDLRGSECASFSQTAKNQMRPADVIWAVDNGPSMQENIDAVRANLNAFSQQIVASGVDTHIIMLSAALDPDVVSMATPLGGSAGGWRAICIGEPLGSGDCPADSKPPAFLHLDEEVGAGHGIIPTPERHPLNLFVQTYDKYKSALRQGAAKTFVVVSDQDATVAPNNTAEAFITNMTAVDPTMFPTFTFSAVVASAPCGGAFPNVAGTVFLDLAAKTGGVTADICAADFKPVFDSLARSVIDAAGIDCSWDIPEVPEGETFDPTKVNVILDSDLGEERIGQVPDQSDCDKVRAGWYYDEPSSPTRLLACDKTCDHINSVANARVDVLFGCASVLAGPE